MVLVRLSDICWVERSVMDKTAELVQQMVMMFQLVESLLTEESVQGMSTVAHWVMSAMSLVPTMVRVKAISKVTQSGLG